MMECSLTPMDGWIDCGREGVDLLTWEEVMLP